MIPTMDQFAGLGGWLTASKRTGGIDIRASLNHNPLACEFLRLNNPHSPRPIRQDLSEADFAEFDEILGGLVIGSPACQGFSSGGAPARRGKGGNGHVNITRNMQRTKANRSTAWALVSAAEMLEPRALLVENVAPFLQWNLFPAWKGALEALGYVVREHVLDAARYGVAQERRRAIVTASRVGPIDLAESWGEPATWGVCNALDLWLDDDGHKWTAIDDAPERTRRLIRSRQEASGLSTGLLNNVGDGVRLRGLEEPCCTLTTKSGGQIMIVDGDRRRMITAREMARVQGWRDSELPHLPQRKADASLLIGNAIPVGLAEGVLAQTLEVIA